MSVVIYYLNDVSALAVVDKLKNESIFDNIPFKEIKVEDIDSMDVNDLAKGLSDLPKYCALIWGDGQQHHTSLILSPNEQFIKSVDDGHSDFVSKPNSGRAYFYTAHNTLLMLYNDKVIEVESIGSNYNIFTEKIDNSKGSVVFYRHSSPSRLLTTHQASQIVHKSIDFDVLHGFPAYGVWQDCNGGTLPFVQIRDDFEALCKKHQVQRLDMGGLYLPKGEEILEYDFSKRYNPVTNKQIFDSAIDCYRQIFRIWFDNIPMRFKK